MGTARRKSENPAGTIIATLARAAIARAGKAAPPIPHQTARQIAAVFE